MGAMSFLIHMPTCLSREDITILKNKVKLFTGCFRSSDRGDRDAFITLNESNWFNLSLCPVSLHLKVQFSDFDDDDAPNMGSGIKLGVRTL